MYIVYLTDFILHPSKGKATKILYSNDDSNFLLNVLICWQSTTYKISQLTIDLIAFCVTMKQDLP